MLTRESLDQNLSLFSRKIEGVYKIGIRANQQYCIAIAKNVEAVTEYENWYKNEYCLVDKLLHKFSLDHFFLLLNDSEKFDLIVDQKEAYSEYIGINAMTWNEVFEKPVLKSPARPNQSFELLKEWYVEIFEAAKIEFLKNSIDNSREIITAYEIEFVQEEIDRTNRMYFTPPPENVREFLKSPSFDPIRPNTVEIAVNRAFLNWLTERMADLSLVKIPNQVKEIMNAPAPLSNQNKIENHEYHLRQFIDIATRWNIDGIFRNVTPTSPFSPILEGFVLNARGLYEGFRHGLVNELTDKANWKAHELDIRDRFLPMINGYLNWFQEHKTETEVFGGYNPYKNMYEIIVSTKSEILKYFPDSPTQETKEPDLPSITPTQENQKVMLLHELGVFDFLIEKHKLKDNYTQLAQIVESFSGIKQDTIRQTYRAILGQSLNEKNNPYNKPKNEEFVINSLNAFGLKRTKKSKPQ